MKQVTFSMKGLRKEYFFRQNGIQKDKRSDLELVAELSRIELNRVPPVLTTTATKSPW